MKHADNAIKKVFKPAYIANCKAGIRDPEFTGYLESESGAITGKDSLKGLNFVPDSRGKLKIWAKPNNPAPAEGKYISNRYCLYVDLGGTTDEADYSVVKVADRYWQLLGGGPEIVCEWRGHIDIDQLAWTSAQIARWYENGLLAVEVNALYNKNNNTEGVHYLQVFEEITEYYSNVFTRKSSDDVKERHTKFGYFMTASSKQQLIDSFRKSLRTKMFVERSLVTGAEIGHFIYDEDGKPNSVEGEHDDSLISSMGVNWLAMDYMDPPKIIESIDMTQKADININLISTLLFFPTQRVGELNHL